MLCSAVALTVVIRTAFDSTADTLDVLIATSLVSTIVHFDNHPFDNSKNPLFALRKAEQKKFS